MPALAACQAPAYDPFAELILEALRGVIVGCTGLLGACRPGPGKHRSGEAEDRQGSNQRFHGCYLRSVIHTLGLAADPNSGRIRRKNVKAHYGLTYGDVLELTGGE